MKKGLCIYHGNCADGFGAAWAVWCARGDDFEYFPAQYGDPIPDVENREVVIVDFSYPENDLITISSRAASVVVIDHHQTAEHVIGLIEDGVVDGVFDQEKSGARLAWEWFHPGFDVPPLLAYIEDRDLWRFSMPQTRAVMASVFSFPYDFSVWSSLDYQCSAPNVSRIIQEGEALLRERQKTLEELLPPMTKWITLDGYCVPSINLPDPWKSEAGHELCRRHPEAAFAVVYSEHANYRVYHLRSAQHGADVSAIAQRFGGGGHRHAAGFRVQTFEFSLRPERRGPRSETIALSPSSGIHQP